MMPVDFGRPLLVLFVTCCISVPLGLWKLAEIAWWLVSHLHWGAP